MVDAYICALYPQLHGLNGGPPEEAHRQGERAGSTEPPAPVNVPVARAPVTQRHRSITS